MSKTQQNFKCNICGKEILYEEMFFHEISCKQNIIYNKNKSFTLTEGGELNSKKENKNPLSFNNININNNNINENTYISNNSYFFNFENFNNFSPEEKLSTEGINNVNSLNSNYINTPAILNNYNFTSINIPNDSSFFIVRGNPLSLSILDSLKPFQIKDKNHIFITKKYQCVICQYEYKEGENCIILSCFHNYHEECIKSWFNSNNICPICKVVIQ